MKVSPILETLLIVVIAFLAWGILLLIAAYSTGRDSRAYAVLSPESLVTLQGQEISTQALVEQYQPEMYLRKTTPSPPLLWIYYEAVETETTIDLVYYYVWENEVNPVPGIDKAYWLFRAAYYGYPVRDIEFFQVKVDKQTGEVVEMLFETSPGDDFFVVFSEHIRARYLLQADGTYLEIRADRQDQELSRQDGIVAMFTEQRVNALAQTWNHLSRLLTPGDEELIEVDAPLKPLTDQEYRSFKFTRKSQGDHQTQENPVGALVAGAASLCLVTIPAGFLLFLRRGRNTPHK